MESADWVRERYDCVEDDCGDGEGEGRRKGIEDWRWGINGRAEWVVWKSAE